MTLCEIKVSIMRRRGFRKCVCFHLQVQRFLLRWVL